MLIATVVGEVALGSWRGSVLVLGPAALLAAPPLAASDSLGMILWFMFTLSAAAGRLAAVGVGAACRGTHRRLRPVPR